MFPLPVVVVGASDSLLPHLRRELANQPAEIEAEFCLAESAIASLHATRKTTRLLLYHVRSAEDLADLRRLSGSFVGWPILACVDVAREPGHLLRANRAGAAQVVPLPLDAPDFREAMNCIAVQFGHPARDSHVFAVCGATGGCGATTVAVNLAYDLAVGHGLPTLLAELTLHVGMLGTYLDLEPRATLPDLLRDVDRLDAYMLQQALVPVAENFSVLAGPHQAIDSLRFAAADLLRVLDLARRLAEALVLDVPCTYNDLQFETLAAADRVVLVGSQSVPAVRGLKLICDSLTPQQVAGGLLVVLNRYDPDLEGFRAKDLERLLKVPQVLTIASDFEAVNKSVNQGRPLRLVAPRSPVLEDIDVLAAALLGVRSGLPPRRKAAAGLFSRLVHAFTR